MNGRVAKKLRKQVYGKEFSPRSRSEMEQSNGTFERIMNGIVKTFKKPPTIVTVGKRAEYLEKKKMYKELKREK